MKNRWKILSLFLLFSIPALLVSDIGIENIEKNLHTFSDQDKIEAYQILFDYYQLSHPLKSLDYALRSFDIGITLKDTLLLFEAAENCATAYGMLNQFDKAKEYYLLALEQNQMINSMANELTLYTNLAYVEFMLANYENSLAYYDILISLYEEQENYSKLADISTKMASIHKILGQYEQALEFYYRSQELDRRNVREIIGNDLLAHYLKSDTLALEYYQLFLESTDSEVLKELLKQKDEAQKTDEELKELQAKESMLQEKLKRAEKETTEKDKFLQNLRQEKEKEIVAKDIELKQSQLELEKRELAIMQQKTRQNYILVVLLVALFLIILNSYLYHMKKMDNKMLEKANDEIRQKNDELILLNKRLEEIARTDPLTNLSNRRDMLEKLEYEKVRFSRGNQSFVIIICDIDNFKIINDTYGHDFGDVVLKRISIIMEKTLRKQDVVSRWGGEEFLLLLPETALVGGLIAAEKIRKKIQQECFEQSGKKIQVTMTFGMEIYEKLEETIATINRADQALYYGKNTGKNKVVTFVQMKK